MVVVFAQANFYVVQASSAGVSESNHVVFGAQVYFSYRLDKNLTSFLILPLLCLVLVFRTCRFTSRQSSDFVAFERRKN